MYPYVKSCVLWDVFLNEKTLQVYMEWKIFYMGKSVLCIYSFKNYIDYSFDKVVLFMWLKQRVLYMEIFQVKCI